MPAALDAGRAGAREMHVTGTRSPRAGEVTRVLEAVRAGAPGAAERLVPLVYAELRSIAGALMRDQRKSHTLQPTALVNEAMLRLLGEASPAWRDRGHFLAIAAGCMRRVLVDHARERGADKRGGGWERVTLDDDLGAATGRDVEILALHAALEDLAARDERQARIVELRYFGGLTITETADYLGISETLAKDEWTMARAWLFRALTSGHS